MSRRRKPLEIPPTRTHRQLANWITRNAPLFFGRKQVLAQVETWVADTDARVAGTRFRRVGKGRRGLILRILIPDANPWPGVVPVYMHKSSDTYRRHEEARRWVAENLRRTPERRP